jgi:hypothetical protein
VITVEPDGKIDPEKVDRDWTLRIDPSQQRDNYFAVVPMRSRKAPILLQVRIANEVIKISE